MNALQVEWHCSGCERLFGNYVESLFTQPDSTVPNLPTDTYGRVLRGSDNDDFTTLADKPDRQVVFLLDAMALSDLIGLDGLEILKRVGYSSPFIVNLLRENTRFKLLVTQVLDVKLATWDNLLGEVQSSYPEWREGIELARPLLKTMSYEKIMLKDGPAKEVRTFLRDTLNVNHLFAGDGFTHREGHETQQVYAEYVFRNRKISELNSFALIDLLVTVPTL